MISGSCKILVFVALEILLSYKILLMGINRPEGIAKFLCNVSKQYNKSLLSHHMVEMHYVNHCWRSFLFANSSNSFSTYRYLKKTQMLLLPKPLTCGTNTAALQSTRYNHMDPCRHLGLSHFSRMPTYCGIQRQWGFVFAWLNWKLIPV